MFSFLKKRTKEYLIGSPVTGLCISLEQVKDPIFSSRMMGDGVAFILSESNIVSPINGKIVAIANTKHAIGLQGENGLELLIHVGVDTVNLQGEGFCLLADVGDTVRIGDKLMEVDLKRLEKEGIDLTTSLIVTNSQEFEITRFQENQLVEAGETKVLKAQARGR